jgi:hypothetical protein
MGNATDHNGHRWETPDVSHIRNPETAHESSDVNVPLIARFIGILAASIVVIGLAMWAMFRYFEARERAAEARPTSVVGMGRDKLPPQPRLQGAPGSEKLPLQEMEEVRKKTEAILNSYGWVDKNAGVVRIPIEEAMRLVVERGLPVRQQTPQPATGQATQ